MQIDVTIITGDSVTVEFEACPAEPENGIFTPYVEDWKVVAINDSAVFDELDPEDVEVIERAIYKIVNNGRRANYDYEH